MGTRSLTVLKDKDEEVCVMYRQFDGYPEGHGMELANFLGEFTITNGMRSGEVKQTANGPDCLFAQIIAHFKDGPGSIYLQKAGTRGVWEEFIYTVTVTEAGEPIMLKVETAGWEDIPTTTIWEGDVVDFAADLCERGEV